MVGRAEHVLVAQNKYRQVKDLKGQTIGSLNPGGLVDALLRQILLQNGLDPDRDVVLINLGGDTGAICSAQVGDGRGNGAGRAAQLSRRT